MTQQTIVDRNTNLDFLRFIAISCIILAHMGIPTIIFQARNFDVPLMVLLSGISFSLYSSKSYSSYPSYLYSRFIRLIIPTWIFLVFYNSMIWAGNNDIPSTYNLCLQFSLIGGSDIGIWIIRIFFSMAIIAPFL
ncbi:MAG TPA: acyltransferase, partial [Desulfobacterales bacterium]|nr:acyltransferase [Desulfobacterales bacterium]